MRKVAPAEVQQLQNLVEGRGVGGSGCTDRRKPAEVAGDLGARQHGFPGSHAVAVTAHGVDLSVVGDEAERCASGHDGKVFVEKRLWTMAMALTQRSSRRSGKYCGSCIVVSMPL